MVRASVQVTTAFVLPERRITNSLGECFGIVVRSLGLGGSVAASFKAMRKGEVTQYTTLLEDSRQQAIDRMVEKAAAMGANAVIGMRFDSSEMMQGLSEIVAYGTAVLVEPTGT
ncbi:MAG: heavy metal-binding domain-containing protein [Actinomycetota bacterium]|nr:heavy metal-binding domain-containing protein [Actinomycetota bacterium]